MSSRKKIGRPGTRGLFAAPLIAGVVLLGVVGTGALGSSGVSATFSGSGIVSAGGTLYAKQNGALTLTVKTSSDTKCVDIDGAHTAHQTSGTAKDTWTFSFTAGAGDGIKSVTASASPNFNANGCTGQSKDPVTTSYVLDNTGPQVAATLTPAPNAAGWNNADVGIAWSATDAGSGIASGPTPAADSVTVSTPAAGVTRTATAADRLGNSGTGSITVKLDKAAPTITATRSPAPNANGWNATNVTASLTCADPLSGIKSCTGGGTKIFSAEGANQSMSATAVDNADNSASSAVNDVNIDKTAPTLSGAIAAGTLGDNGWYRSNVTIHWSCSDTLSGIDGPCPADSTIAGEGQDLVAGGSVADKAGNATNAQSPTVKIDRTAPNTDASADDAWNNVDVAIDLTPHDALSGVASTQYTVDGGMTQSGTHVSIGSEGKHTLEYWSVDGAGNVEAHKTVAVNLDKTSPTITHAFDPHANANGWHRGDVTVTFSCDDALSGIKSCGPDRVISNEGADQDAGGTAVDNAGNTAHDPAKVSLDATAPTITATADRPANANGWYDANVTVSFDCHDALSGVDTCPAAQVLGEGADQSADATVSDAAGNTASDKVAGIDVDKTPPTLTGKASMDPNGDGWYQDDVVVAWTCEDTLSGLDGACPADSTVGGEGGNLSASRTVSDKAGNVAATTVDGIKIDRAAPTTSASVPEPLDSGWYPGPVKVTLHALDALSDVAATYYRIDDGEAQTYTDPFDVTDKGIHTIHFWSVDHAGNVEDRTAPGHALALKIDGVPPVIHGIRTPPNGFGWNNGDVTVSFACTDAESGIAGCSDPLTLSNEGAGQSAEGNALDNAGNSSSTKVEDINIDRMAPTLTGLPTTDANAANWYRDDVTVTWTGADGLSGIDPSTQPADTVVTGEGDDLVAGPASISDKAGNTTQASVGPLKIDHTAPAVAGAPTTSPNAAGWYSGNVVVAFSCTDGLSGVASCPSDKVLSANGADQSVTSAPATDVAGNSSLGKTVGGINIDGLPPQTTADNTCVKANGWCTGSTATVVLTATDQTGLSGVKEIHYRINSDAEEVAAGATTSIVVPLDGSGEASVRFQAVDKAGNLERENGISLKYDNIAPTVTHTLAPSPNADQWNSSDVAVHFIAKDNDGGSGVDAARTTSDVGVSVETAGRAVDGEAFDVAGNQGSDSVTVKLDKTAPSIHGTVVSGQLGDGGWYVGPVTVHFTCSDGLSGVVVCPDDVTLTANGADQSVKGKAVDVAGNEASATVSGIDIDRERPAITLKGIAAGGVYTLGSVPTASCSAQDDVSGVVSCDVAVSGGRPNGVGTRTYTATAKDRAGNTTTQTGTYRVIYRYDGFLQPINDTAHQVDASTSIFKAGSTVPAKFQLKRADGTVVAANDLPAWETPAKGSPTTAAVDETLYGAVADSASTYRYDASARQYIYNWSTSAATKSYYYRIGVRLDDGQTYFVNLGLR
ncbi:MAG TPA: PxKF domain-containing protein [Baekduia sp.]|uniref:OmpL47-type beta-barrel domain-containing protein n=1 Tax=Baekduia sp. TaxID=2600305 RepID=UPI002BDE41C9|nr:PxKF domain-containing protein [Baekduia sp.]HMJ32750.1 PxKF domain-containing protein [Baekduia sp.]